MEKTWARKECRGLDKGKKDTNFNLCYITINEIKKFVFNQFYFCFAIKWFCKAKSSLGFEWRWCKRTCRDSVA